MPTRSFAFSKRPKAPPSQTPSLTLRDFIRQAWPIVEPATPYIANWHLDLIADHLEAVTWGEIRNLLINIPPRHMKSLAVSVFWPCWVWTFKPATRWLYTSYAESLSIRDSLKCRRLIQSPWYQERWGSVFELTGDQNVKGRFENTATGYRLASSVSGSNTGEGGDVVVVDDAHNIQEAESELVRGSVLTWWDEVMSTRLNDPKTGARVIVMQRVHERDLAGHVLERGGYHHLRLPARFEEPAHDCEIGRDPRQREGELLWPDRFDEAALAALEQAMGSHAAAGQLQQRPSPREGAIFKRDWFRLVAPPPEICRPVYQFWDTAYEAKSQSDYSVCQTWSVEPTGYRLVDVWRERAEYPALKRKAIELAQRFKPAAVVIEDIGSGKTLLQDFRSDSRLPVLAYRPDRDKVSRAHAVTPVVESGRVLLPPSAPWLEAFLDEVTAFPVGQHDDQVDALTMALALMAVYSANQQVKVSDFAFSR